MTGAHAAELGLYEDVMPRLERTAIGVWAIARGLEDHAQLTGGEHRPMEAMGALLAVPRELVRVFAGEVLGDHPRVGWREPCRRCGCDGDPVRERRTGSRSRSPTTRSDRPARRRLEWMSYTALLVQVDRIVDDLRAPLPT